MTATPTMTSLSDRPASTPNEKYCRKYLPPKSDSREAVKVMVRCRPMSAKETDNQYTKVIECDTSKRTIVITNPKSVGNEEQVKMFTFDAVFDETSSQEEVYRHVEPLVTSVLEGFNGTIFAYGQTGTGKTYTMEGCLDDPKKHGIILRTFDQIFKHITSSTDRQFLVRCSYMEIYQEEIRDLLSPTGARCEVRESSERGIFVKDVSSYVSKSIEEITDIMSMGNRNRSTGTTDMNEHSSRSHAIFTLTIETMNINEAGSVIDARSIRVGKLSLVDLAGSERQGKSGSTGDRLKEATKINLSLSALSKVMAALVEGNAAHIPYRDSKLTRILQDSLGGNAKTIMVANVGPASYNRDESLITLRYAQRAKMIQNAPVVNEDPTYALVQEYKAEIERLKQLLVERRAMLGKRTGSAAAMMAEGGAERGRDRPTTGRTQPTISEEERKRMIKYEQQLKKAISESAEATQKLDIRIAEMESKLICGGNVSIVDYTLGQQRVLDSQQKEINDRKLAEEEMLQELEEHDNLALDKRRSYTSLQQEVDHKTSKLKRLMNRYQWTKKKIQQVADEYSQDRRDLELERRELLKQVKLNQTIMQNVIPPSDVNALIHRLVYDEQVDDWVDSKEEDTKEAVKLPFRKRPIATRGCRRPVSEFSRTVTRIGHQLRYQAENILQLNLLPPQRLTLDYAMPVLDAGLLSHLDGAFEEDVLVIDAAHFGRSRSQSTTRLTHGNYLGRLRERFTSASSRPRY